MFQYIQEQIKNQNISDYEITDFILDYMNNHMDSTQKDSVIDLIIDCIKYTKFQTRQLKDII